VFSKVFEKSYPDMESTSIIFDPSGLPIFPTLLTSLPELLVAFPNEVILLAMPSILLKAVLNSESMSPTTDDEVLAAASGDEELDEATLAADVAGVVDVTFGLATAMMGEATGVVVADEEAVGVATVEVF
jgi:hypothetical protein